MKECWGCGNYKEYYTKGFCKFDKEKLGYCNKQKKIVGNHDGCESWRNNISRRKSRKTVSLKALETALSDISVIKQILSEDAEEKENQSE